MSIAFVFPGQGSQSVGMLQDLASTFSIVGDTFSECSDALGFDLWNLVSEGPDEQLNDTSNTQPAMLAAGVAVWRVWQQENGSQPALMAGHSLGEYSALVCAGTLKLTDAATLVRARGQYMQQAVPAGQGAMAAVLGLDDDQVAELCAENANGEVLSPVNYNSPGQVVIAGTADAVARAVEGAKPKGARKAVILPVSVPSHCALMKPAAEQLLETMNSISFSSPEIPVIHNVDVSTHKDSSAIIDSLAMQLYQPVRWVETIRSMHQQGITQLVECGPGKVLAGLNKRIEKSMPAHAVFDSASLEKALSATGE